MKVTPSKYRILPKSSCNAANGRALGQFIRLDVPDESYVTNVFLFSRPLLYVALGSLATRAHVTK
jgi:hypothetical protein